MNVRFITSLRDFDAMGSTWRALAQESRQTSPFLSHDWFACCWRTAGPNRRRELWMVEDSAGPVALLPLVLCRATLRGLPVRVLQVLQSPDTPLIDFLVTRGVEEVTDVVLKTLRARRDWDILSLNKLSAESATLKALRAALPGQFPWRVAGTTASPYLSVVGGWEPFFRGKSQRFRKTFRNLENKILRLGDVRVEEHRDVDPDGRLFAEVLEVSRASWKGPQGVAMATMQGMPRFFNELTRRATANGWLHLWVLRAGGRAVATEYQIDAEGRRYALRADFDSALADVSPGGYLNQQIIRTLFDDPDVREYDMGPGTNEYKLRWASGEHETTAIDVYAPTAYGRCLHAIEARLVPLARRWRAHLSPRCA